MKNLFILSLGLFVSIAVLAQTKGRINYQETTKFTINADEVKGIDISGMLPESRTIQKALIFDGNQSIYIDDKVEERENTEISSEDGSFQIVLMEDDSEDILYTDIKEKKYVHQQGFMGKSFVVLSDLEKYAWKIGADKVKYLGYECTKATRQNELGEEEVAWFTPQIPAQVGPGYHNQLPGAILMFSVNDGKIEIKAIDILFENVETEKIKAPKDGKKVNAAEFEEIQEEKLKEMKEEYGGDDESFIISE